jgi:hypothetical protein
LKWLDCENYKVKTGHPNRLEMKMKPWKFLSIKKQQGLNLILDG